MRRRSEPSALEKLGKYRDTIKYLKPVQIVYRIKSIFVRNTVRLLGVRSHHVISKLARDRFGKIRLEPKKLQVGDEHRGLPRELHFLNDPTAMPLPPDWNINQWRDRLADPHLWWFHLHYFDWMRPKATPDELASARGLIDGWIKKNKLGAANCFHGPWHPYTISQRLPNLINFLHLYRDVVGKIDRKIMDSIGMQFWFLLWNIEKEHLANHYLENLFSIVHCSHLIKCVGIEKIRRIYKRKLIEQLRSQILNDGMHEERCPYYHGEILMRLKSLRCILGGDRDLDTVIEKMESCLRMISHPDGLNPLFGDGGFVDEDLRSAWSQKSSEPSLNEIDEHIVYRHESQGDFLIFDAGKISVDHNMAHGHCDLMGFELSLGGKRIVSDGGGGIYKSGQVRENLRCSREHAVLVVNGVECAEPWKSFRMGRRGHPLSRDLRRTGDEKFRLSAIHDGFSPIQHRRQIFIDSAKREFEIRDSLIIRDEKYDRDFLKFESFVPVFAGIEIERQADSEYALLVNGNIVAVVLFAPTASRQWKVDVIPGIIYTHFGPGTPRSVLRFSGLVAPGEEFGYTIQGVSGSIDD